MPKERCMNVKMDAELVRKAKMVAAMKNITLLKYIAELVRPQVERDLATMALGLAELAAADSAFSTGNGEPRIG